MKLTTAGGQLAANCSKLTANRAFVQKILNALTSTSSVADKPFLAVAQYAVSDMCKDTMVLPVESLRVQASWLGCLDS